MTDERDEIRSRIDIVELVGQSVSLKKFGKSLKGLCPFHPDKNPSMHVSAEYGRYNCFACGAKGDIFDWVMNTRSVDFREALEILAQQAGVELRRKSPEEAAQSNARRSVMEEALSFFRQSLETSPQAKEYCKGRGIDETVIGKWELGYAPDVAEAIPVHLQRKQYKLAECLNLFLVDKDQSGGYYGKFRNRLMFPIRNERGDLVAFGGRLLGDGQPKYVNSSDTPLYKKSQVLYGLHLAKESLAKTGTAILCEGYLDVIACHQAGLRGAVASLGTALSDDHARLLKRWAKVAVVLYDGDSAGQAATERALDIILAGGLEAKVAMLPKDQDPDTLIREFGEEALQKVVASAVSPLDFRIHCLERRLGVNTEEFWNEVVPVLATATSELALSKHLVRLSGAYPGLHDPISAQRALRRQIDQVRRRTKTSLARPVQHIQASALPLIHRSEGVIFRSLMKDELKESAYGALKEPGLIYSPTGNELVRLVLEIFPASAPDVPPAVWLPKLPSSAQSAFATFEDIPADAAFLSGAIRALATKRARREISALRRSDGNDRLEAIQKRLQELQSER